MSNYDKDFQAAMQNAACDFAVCIEKSPEQLFSIVENWWPSVKRLSDIYSLPGILMYPDIKKHGEIDKILEQLQRWGVDVGRSTGFFFGDDLTDLSYKITVDHRTLMAICDIPQNNIILMMDVELILILSFYDEAILALKPTI